MGGFEDPRVTGLPELTEQLIIGLGKAEALALTDDETAGRNGAICGLIEICRFVQGLAASLGDPRDRAAMLGRAAIFDTVASALDELRDGIVAPILKPGAIHNRAQMPRHVRTARGWAAASVELLRLSGKPIRSAAKLVARHIDGRQELQGITEPPWKAVQRWRSKCLKATDRPTWEDFRTDPRVNVEVAIFDEALRWRDEMFKSGKSTPRHLCHLAFLILDQGRETLSQKEPS